MRHHVAHALLFLAGMIAGLTTAHAQELDVTAEVLTPAVDAQPRQAVSLQVRFTNTGTAWRTVAASVAVPGGWIVLVPPGDITLAPGETGITLLTVLVAPDAPGKAFTFPMTYRTSVGTEPGEALFTIRVPALDQAALTLVEAPAIIPATEPHRVEFLLRNTGNTTHEWDLTATSSLRLSVTLTPSVVTLGPAESTPVVALVSAPERLTQQQTHALTVTATSRSLPDLRTTARAAVQLVPTHLPADSALHTFPLTIRASYKGNPLAAADHPHLTIDVSGRGTISDRDPGRLDVRLRMTPTNLLERVTFDYQRPIWGVRLGHQDFTPSPLSSSTSGIGVSATMAWPLGATDQLRTALAAYLEDGEAHFAVAATAALPHGMRLGATLSGGSSELLGTLGIRYAPERRDPTAVQLTALETTYGVRAGGGGAAIGQALRITAQVNGGPTFARLTYDTAAATFDGRDRHHATLRAATTLRLNDALSIQARIPLNLTLGYDHTWAWNDDLAYRLLPPADAQRQEQRYTVGVSAGLGLTSVTASYGLTTTNLASHDRQHELRALVRTRITDDLTVAQSGLWTRRQLLGTMLSDELELQTAAALRTDAGLLTTAVTMTHDLDAGLTSGLAFGVKWTGDPTPDLRLNLDATLHLLDPDERWSAGVDLRYLLDNQRVLTTKLTGQARADRPFSLTFELGLTLPLQVPVGRRTEIGRLEGSLTRPDGRGLPGAIVTVAGQSVTTTPDGAFTFPALPVGEHLVHVVTAGGLGITEYLTPDLPAGVVILDDTTIELHFVVHEGATVAGRIATEALDPTTGRTAITPNGSADGLVRGVRIELRNGATTLPTVTDASGAFRFQRVPAGEWTLHILLPRTATDYRIDPHKVRVALKPGGHEAIIVRLVPIVRHIQFDDGGTLTPQDTR